MPVYTQDDAKVFVYTYKQGVLSKIAHDLKLAVTRFEITVDGDEVTGDFDPRSLVVLDAVSDGVVRPGVLSEADKRKIEQNIRAEVLEVDQYAAISFNATDIEDADDEIEIEGMLALHGVSRAVSAVARRQEGRIVVRFTLNQPDFGIKPYSAVMGAIKLKPTVEVTIELPDPRP